MATGEHGDDGGSARRRELLHKAFDYVTERGVSDLSLRPLAAEIGTSPRVLLYLFGSKDGLVREVLALARRIELDAVARIADQPDQPDQPDRAGVDLRGLWDWLSDEEHRPILRLFLEAYARSLHDTEPWQGFASTSVSQWLDLLRPLGPHRPLGSPGSPGSPGPPGPSGRDGVGGVEGARTSEADRDVWATLTLAVIRGLFLDLAALGDAERVGAAFTRYLETVGL